MTESPKALTGLDAGAHTVDAQKFNSWVIGGGYSKAQMKRNQIRTDLQMQKRHATAQKASNTHDPLEIRKSEIKEQSREVQPYKPKKAEALREERRRQAEEVYASRRAAAGSPPRTSEGERYAKAAEVFKATHPPEETDVALELRARLLQSFQAPTTAQSYGTLFPPLLLPYSRPMTFMRGRERPRSPSPKAEAPTFEKPNSRAGASEKTMEAFGLPVAERRRAQPHSGPSAFMPTGSSTTAYRHFTNYGLLARMNAANAEGLGVSASAAPTLHPHGAPE